MTVPLPDEVLDALYALSSRLSEHGLKLYGIEIRRAVRKQPTQEYNVFTPGGVVTVKQEL